MIVLIDNFDSFAYNVVQFLGSLGADVQVFRNDETTPEHLFELGPRGIVISPGPRAPREAGVSKAVIERFAGRVPILGVCLGHQCIAEAFGGRVVKAKTLMHGKTSRIRHSGRGGEGWISAVPTPFRATRYHSLAVDPESVPESLEVTAWADDGEIMGIRHRRWQVEGVQFHPESILSEGGGSLFAAFLTACGELAAAPRASEVAAIETSLKGVVPH